MSLILLIGNSDIGLADLNEFKKGCIDGCVKSADHQDYCNKHCNCVVSNLPKSSGGNSGPRTNLSKAEIEKLNHVCSGEAGLALMVEKCSQSCNSDATCLKVCQCLSRKIRENRTPEQIGKYFNSLAANSAEMTKLQRGCVKP